MDKNTAILLAFVGALAAIGYGIVLIVFVLRQPDGNERMRNIAAAIQEGAGAYLNRQYTTIAIVGVVILIILAVLLGVYPAIGFAVGALLSGAAGFIGMNVSVRANVRTAEAARQGLAKGLDVSFKAGAVTGMLVVALGLLGVTLYFGLLLALGVEERRI